MRLPKESCKNDSYRAKQKSNQLTCQLTRRGFLGDLAGAGIVATVPPLLHTAPPTTEPLVANETQNTEGTVEVTLEINGTVKHLQIEPRVTLLDASRENLGLFGTKKDCDHGQYGARTVHVNGRRINSCP